MLPAASCPYNPSRRSAMGMLSSTSTPAGTLQARINRSKSKLRPGVQDKNLLTPARNLERDSIEGRRTLITPVLPELIEAAAPLDTAEA